MKKPTTKREGPVLTENDWRLIYNCISIAGTDTAFPADTADYLKKLIGKKGELALRRGTRGKK